MLKAFKNNSRGFTLIELLVVIGILAVLFAIVLVAINPARQFSQANNTKRNSDVATILNAVGQYAADNQGSLPTGITTTAQEIKAGAGGADICTALVPKYVAALPADPTVGGGAAITDCALYSTGYNVVQSATDSRVTVNAPSAELGATISVTR